QIERTRVLTAQLLGKLVSIDDYDHALSTLAQVFAEALDALPSRLDLPVDAEVRCEDECRAVRDELAETIDRLGAELAASRTDLATGTDSAGLAVGGEQETGAEWGGLEGSMAAGRVPVVEGAT
ncbi:MAG: hypothetical protein KDK91_32300, partial [Gammaproteobacteria bacterium]|nr:hypothetical protein [Gammaproteobacteria bacterium]